MKTGFVLALSALLALAAQAQPRRVALVVQNHASDAPSLPMAALADTLAAELSGDVLRVVNPQNALGADGVVVASIQELASEEIGAPAVAYALKVRLTLCLMDAATGETVCGVSDFSCSKNYTAEQVKADAASLFEGLMHAAAAKSAKDLLDKVATSGWPANPAP